MGIWGQGTGDRGQGTGDRFEHEDAPVSVEVVRKNEDGSFLIEVEVGARVGADAEGE